MLGRVEAPPAGDVAAVLGRAAAGLSWGATVVLIAAAAPADLIERIIPLRRRGLRITLVLVEGGPEQVALARRHGIPSYMVSRAGAPQRP
jgi:hypothetical protein